MCSHGDRFTLALCSAQVDGAEGPVTVLSRVNMADLALDSSPLLCQFHVGLLSLIFLKFIYFLPSLFPIIQSPQSSGVKNSRDSPASTRCSYCVSQFQMTSHQSCDSPIREDVSTPALRIYRTCALAFPHPPDAARPG